METAQREIVIQRIKDHIERHGYCRVGWAARMVLNQKTEIPVVDKEQIANLCVQSGEYIKEKAAKSYTDWNIVKNSSYFKTQLEIDMIAVTKMATKRNFYLALLNIVFGASNIIIAVSNHNSNKGQTNLIIADPSIVQTKTIELTSEEKTHMEDMAKRTADSIATEIKKAEKK
jgi:hypothetical protein